jgi:hypothetical protein
MEGAIFYNPGFNRGLAFNYFLSLVGSSKSLPIILTSLAGTGFSSTEAGVGP